MLMPLKDYRNRLENEILYCSMIGEYNYKSLDTSLTANHFKIVANKKIFDRIKLLAKKNMPMDLTYLVFGEEEKPLINATYLNKVFDDSLWTPPSLLNFKCKQLMQLCDNEDVKVTLQNLQNASGEDLMKAANSSIKALTNFISNTHESKSHAGGDIVLGLLENIAKIKSGGIKPYLPTGVTSVDSLLKFTYGGLHIIAARPRIGKSALGFQIAANVLSMNMKVSVFSLEMSDNETMSRVLSNLTGIPHRIIKDARTTSEEEIQIKAYASAFNTMQFKLYDKGGMRIDEIENLCMIDKPDFIIVDYLQKIVSDNNKLSSFESVSDCSTRLKNLAKDLGVPVLALAQLNRGPESRGNDNKIYSLADLRGSGQIEQDADSIAIMIRETSYDQVSGYQISNSTELQVVKQRDGEMGSVYLVFEPEYMRFISI